MVVFLYTHVHNNTLATWTQKPPPKKTGTRGTISSHTGPSQAAFCLQPHSPPQDALYLWKPELRFGVRKIYVLHYHSPSYSLETESLTELGAVLVTSKTQQFCLWPHSTGHTASLHVDFNVGAGI